MKAVSAEKAMRTFNYLQTKMMKFAKRNADIVYRHKRNVDEFENFKRGCMIYVYCSKCKTTYLVSLKDYIKNPSAYGKEWICFNCEQDIISSHKSLMHKSEFVRCFPTIEKITFNNGEVIYIGHRKYGKKLTDSQGRCLYGEYDED